MPEIKQLPMAGLSVQEAADILGVSTKSVLKEIQDKRLPAFRVRNSLRIRRDWLEQYQEQQRVT